MAEKSKVIVPPPAALSRVNGKNFKKGGAVGKANAKPKMFMKKMGKK
jgi:hypothetical protein